MTNNEFNIACDLNDYSWFEKIEKDKGVIFVFRII